MSELNIVLEALTDKTLSQYNRRNVCASCHINGVAGRVIQDETYTASRLIPILIAGSTTNQVLEISWKGYKIMYNYAL